MSELKKVIVTLPEELLDQADGLSREEGKNRSVLVREAITLYLDQKKKNRIREQMERGYAEMGEWNLALAEEGLSADEEALSEYERIL